MAIEIFCGFMRRKNRTGIERGGNGKTKQEGSRPVPGTPETTLKNKRLRQNVMRREGRVHGTFHCLHAWGRGWEGVRDEYDQNTVYCVHKELIKVLYF